MPDLTHLPLFLVASAVLLLTPGPAVLYVIARSASQGRRAGLVSVLSIEGASTPCCWRRARVSPARRLSATRAAAAGAGGRAPRDRDARCRRDRRRARPRAAACRGGS